MRGWSQGNHALDCTVIVPDNGNNRPIIAWANGWDQGNVLGQCTTNGYLPGLKQWARDGPFVVAAANQWSVQESDVLACAQWVAQNPDLDVDGSKIGLVGHSQGGGAVIKAGDGNRAIDITAVMAMNPYGPSWVRPENQDGPVFIVGGEMDTTTPPSSYAAMWEAISAQGDPGGIHTALVDGTHNSDAWGTDPLTGATLSCEGAAEKNFGRYQSVGLLWWQIQLRGTGGHRQTLRDLLNSAPWTGTEYSGF